jgi:predicted GIY-YIG superfamily endonuclease
MDIRIHDKTGNYVSLEDCVQDMQSTIITLQATIVQLEYQMNTQQKEQAKETEESPKSDYDKLKEEIIEEVNLIISDLL